MTRSRPLPPLLLLVIVVMTAAVMAYASATTSASAANVTVFRCCGPGEALDLTDDDDDDDDHGNDQLRRGRRCVTLPATEPQDFVPVIYDVDSNQFLAPNTTPPPYWNMVLARPPCRPAGAELLLPGTPPGSPSGYVPFLNGSLWVQHLAAALVDPGQFCLDRNGALVCRPSGGERRPHRTKKCCGPGAAYSEPDTACRVLAAGDRAATGLPADVASGFPRCDGDVYVMSGRLNESHWPVRGEQWATAGGPLHAGPESVLHTRDYCLERVLGGDDEGGDGRPVVWTVFTCAPRHRDSDRDVTTKSYREDIRFTLYPLGLLLSVVFLAITLVASCMLPSTYHVLHWKCQVNHVGCLLVGDLCLAFVQLSGDSLRGPFCVFTAIVMHFVFLAAFFWLNTMCFNIWWTFRDLRPANLDKGQEACRLRLYQLYAWGVPFVIATLAAVLDRIPPDQYVSLIRPKFGEHRCWFYGDAEVLSYFYGPIGILLMMNLTLFAATARELTCGLWRTEVVKSTSERATLGRVCLKLVIVMGITWVVDVLSWVIGGPDYVWYLTDLMNTLQGVLIFIVVGCQPQVWMAVRRVWCLRRRSSSDSPSDGGNARSSTSNAMPSTVVNESCTLSAAAAAAAAASATAVKPAETLC